MPASAEPEMHDAWKWIAPDAFRLRERLHRTLGIAKPTDGVSLTTERPGCAVARYRVAVGDSRSGAREWTG